MTEDVNHEDHDEITKVTKKHKEKLCDLRVLCGQDFVFFVV
jgi:hypothetical protein